MSTDTDTATEARPAVWLRKFNAWARKQTPNDKGVIELLGPHDTIAIEGTPWAGKLTDCLRSRIAGLTYNPTTEQMTVTVEGRNYADLRTDTWLNDRWTWPMKWSDTYDMSDLPEGSKRIIMAFAH